MVSIPYFLSVLMGLMPIRPVFFPHSVTSECGVSADWSLAGHVGMHLDGVLMLR